MNDHVNVRCICGEAAAGMLRQCDGTWLAMCASCGTRQANVQRISQRPNAKDAWPPPMRYEGCAS